MRILFLSPVFPLPLDTGTKVRIFNIISLLLDRGHHVGLVSMVHAEQLGLSHDLGKRLTDMVLVPVRTPSEKPFRQPAPWKERGKRAAHVLRDLLSGVPLAAALAYHPKIAEAVRRLEPEYDVIFVEFFFMARNISNALFQKARHKLVLVEHDISFVPRQRRYQVAGGLRRFRAWVNYRLYRGAEIATLKKFSHVIAMSEPDRRTLLSFEPGRRITVAPNGVNPRLYSFNPKPAQDRLRLLFVGGLLHEPNLDGLVFFIRDILPVLAARFPQIILTVAGRTHGVEDRLTSLPCGHMVRLAGFVPDLNEIFTRSTAMIVPLRIGGGTRLKVIEAMAAGVPVIATAVGAEGLPVKDREHVLFAENAREFLNAIQVLMDDGVLREQMVHSARMLVERSFSWETIVTTLEMALAEKGDGP